MIYIGNAKFYVSILRKEVFMLNNRIKMLCHAKKPKTAISVMANCRMWQEKVISSISIFFYYFLNLILPIQFIASSKDVENDSGYSMQDLFFVQLFPYL